MNKAETIREIEEEANRRAMYNPQTDFVVKAKAAIEVLEALDPEQGADW